MKEATAGYPYSTAYGAGRRSPLDGVFTVQRPSRLYPSALTALLGYGEVGGVLAAHGAHAKASA